MALRPEPHSRPPKAPAGPARFSLPLRPYWAGSAGQSLSACKARELCRGAFFRPGPGPSLSASLSAARPPARPPAPQSMPSARRPAPHQRDVPAAGPAPLPLPAMAAWRWVPGSGLPAVSVGRGQRSPASFKPVARADWHCGRRGMLRTWPGQAVPGEPFLRRFRRSSGRALGPGLPGRALGCGGQRRRARVERSVPAPFQRGGGRLRAQPPIASRGAVQLA